MLLTPALATAFSRLGAGQVLGPVSGVLLEGAVAVRENVLRLTFSESVYWSGLGDENDASKAGYYDVAIVAGTSGLDGESTHAVQVVSADLDPDDPVALLLTLDRPMTAYPSQYVVSVSGLANAGQTALLLPDSAQFYGVFKQLVTPDAAAPHPARDFANPQTLAALQGQNSVGVSGGPVASLALATFNVDETGDYAFDEGTTSLKKRIYRRLVTRPGGFAHLGNSYGVGIPQQGKHLARAATLQQLASEAEKQISQEPEVAKVRVSALNTNNGLVRFVVLVRTKAGIDARLTATFPIK